MVNSWQFMFKERTCNFHVIIHELNINFYSSFPSVRYLVAYGEKSIKSFQIYQIFSNQTNLLQQFHFVYDASLWGAVLKVYL